MKGDKKFMAEALEQARRAEALGEVPVGAVVVHRGQIIARGYNLRETEQDPTAHAELLAVREAARVLGTWRLHDCAVFVTLEPCPMCAGMLVNARVGRLVFGARDPKAGAVRSLYALVEDPRLNHRMEVRQGCLEGECSAILTRFFEAIRQARREASASEDSRALGDAHGQENGGDENN